ncbi:MAG: SPFH domain-containing protein [Candidatus Nanoarchaeia archaeon]|jgi:regulator of protease activity HflC (stomatin/prohibitin superfamily)
MREDLFIALLIIVGFALLFYFQTWTFYLFIFIVVFMIFYIFFIKKYDEFERGIIFRMGKFSRVAGPGWSVVIPFFEKEFSRIDARTRMIELNIDEAYTLDDLRLNINGMFYYRIVDAEKAILKIDNYTKGIQNLIISQTRNVIGKLNMREVFSNLSSLNDILIDAIKNDVLKWGIDVNMIQLKEVIPPMEIAIAMQSKEIASNDLQATRFKAEAKKLVMKALGEGAKNFDDKAMMYLYIEALKSMGEGPGSKIIFPAEFMKIVGTVGAGLSKGSLKDADVPSLIAQVKNALTGTQ